MVVSDDYLSKNTLDVDCRFNSRHLQFLATQMLQYDLMENDIDMF